MHNAKEIKYIKMEDAFAIKDFSLFKVFAMFVHLILLTIYQGLDASVLLDIPQ